MTMLNATFASLNAFPMVRGNRSVERRSCNTIDDFRAQAAECQELANYWGGEAKRQYAELARQWLEIAELAGRRR
jgi:hypothetical protein